MAPRIPIIFGTMTLGDKDTGGVRISEDVAGQAIISTYSKSGTELDSARNYCDGTTEQMLSRLDLKGCTVDSKCYPVQPGDHAPEELRASLNKTLAALKTDKLRIFYLHAPDRSTPFEDTAREMNKLHQEGKFEHFGVSNFAAWELAELYTICDKEGWVKPSVYQGMYNAITRTIETELFTCCRKYNIRIVVYNPLAGGVLAGKLQGMHDQGEKGGRFDSTSAQGKRYRERYFRDVYFEAVEVIKKALAGTDISLTGAALRWVEHHSLLTEKDGVIIGASSNEQLEDNLKQLQAGPLPDTIVKALDQAWQITKADSPNYWR